jgi:hypothetical protein
MRLMIPDGKVTFPGANMLPMTVHTSEISVHAEHRLDVEEHGKAMCQSLNLPPDATPSKAAAHGGPEGNLNFGKYRSSVLTTYD